jgi:hypothetical protein
LDQGTTSRLATAEADARAASRLNVFTVPEPFRSGLNVFWQWVACSAIQFFDKF